MRRQPKPRQITHTSPIRKLHPHIPCKARTRSGEPCKAIKTYYCHDTKTWRCKNHGGLTVKLRNGTPMTQAVKARLISLKRQRSEIERAALMIRLGMVK